MKNNILRDILNFKDYKQKGKKLIIARTMVSIVAAFFFPLCMLVLMEYAIPNQNIQWIVIGGIVFFVVNILRAIVTYNEGFKAAEFSQGIAGDYREELFIKLQKIKQKQMDQYKAGNMIESMINDTKQIASYFSDGIVRVYFAGLARFASLVVILSFVNIKIMVIGVSIYMIGFAITYLFNQRSMHYTQIKRKMNARILDWSSEEIEGFQTIKSLTIEKERIKELKQLVEKYNQASKQLDENIRKYTFIYEFLTSFVTIVTITLGGMEIIQGVMSYGAITILTRYIGDLNNYAKWIFEGFQYRNISEISYHKVKEILEKEEEKLEVGKDLEKIETIEFKEIEFAYDDNQKVIKELNLTVNPKEKIALIGRTGSGKTSLVNLLCRFYDLKEGTIEINEEDYLNYSIQSLRSRIGYVMQKVVLFNGTILENINYEQKNISKEEIIEVCKELKLHEKIEKLPEGYETIITENTDILSSGEKQLINFARVMLGNPDVIILDEVTASLSYQSEMLVREAIRQITKNRISFIIAHRLSTIKDCDKILVMSKGQIVEQGTHQELLEKKGEYYQLLNKVG